MALEELDVHEGNPLPAILRTFQIGIDGKKMIKLMIVLHKRNCRNG